MSCEHCAEVEAKTRKALARAWTHEAECRELLKGWLEGNPDRDLTAKTLARE